jgi:hypothetical protein
MSEGIPSDTDLTELFKIHTMPKWGLLNWEWQSFISELDYGGYDFSRMKIDAANPQSDGKQARIAADRGWQSTEFRVHAGRKYRLTAQGRYQIVGGQETWMCEPGGVTIEYHDGRPLGALLGAVVSSTAGAQDGDPSFLRPILIGLDATITPKHDARLYVRVNEAPSGLADNRGEVTITMEEIAN